MDDAGANFFHRNPLELVRGLNRRMPVEPRQRPAAKLLRALGGDVDEQKATGDWSRGLERHFLGLGILSL